MRPGQTGGGRRPLPPCGAGRLIPPRGLVYSSILYRTELYLESQVAQNNRLLYPKVAHNLAKVEPNYRLLAFQVLDDIIYIQKGGVGSESGRLPNKAQQGTLLGPV